MTTLMVPEKQESIFSFNRPPILLIGSGISLRYLKAFPDWEELLRRIADRIGIDDGRFIAFKQSAKMNCNKETGEMPRLATELKVYLNEEIKNGHINPRLFFNDAEYLLYAQGVDSIKILATSLLNRLELVDDPSLVEELEILKKLVDVVPCVVTTNYDCLLEEKIFSNQFEVFCKVSDYYLSDSQGIGEIFKIHGTIKDPKTMIINEEDYSDFKENSKIVSAKLLSTLCDFPLVILGYRLNDSDVKSILNDLMSSLDDEKIKALERNIIYISYTPGESGFSRFTTNFEYRKRRLSISSVGTGNFKAIYQELSKMTPSTSPSKIRKLRQLVRKIVVGNKSTEEKIWTISIDDISQEDADKLVVAITDENIMRALDEKIKDIPIFTTNHMVEDIMSGISRYAPIVIVNYFQKSKRFRKTEYVPIFQFLRSSGLSSDNYTPFLKDFIAEKKKQFPAKLELLSSEQRTKSVTDLDGIRNAIEEASPYQKPIIIMHYLKKGTITEDQAFSLLKTLYDEVKKNGPLDSDQNFWSNFKCALTYLPFKDIGFEE